MRHLRSPLGLLALLLALAVLAPLAPVLAFDRAVSHTLFALPRTTLTVLNLVWVVGALPVTAALLLIATLGRPLPSRARAASWAAFAALGLCEVMLKRLIATPQPHGPAVSVPLLHALIQDLNIDAHEAAGWLAATTAWLTGRPLPPQVTTTVVGPRGTFPSGHVARLTFLAGYLFKAPRTPWLLAVAGLAGLAVVATGGHWLWDALGGLVLALAWLRLAKRWKP